MNIKKIASITLMTLILTSMLSLLFIIKVEALDDDMNLDGYIWRHDGFPPNVGSTEFCVWVEYPAGGGPLFTYRYPITGWYTAFGIPDQLMWYSCVLPAEDKATKWDNGANYWIWVDGSPWNELNGNCTSNGTGTLDDAPIPPLGSTDPHVINWGLGGEENNEQQWDVRTQAPIDLVPTNVSVNGTSYQDYPATGIPVAPGQTVTISFNVTNLGTVGSQALFNATAWNCTDTGLPYDINDWIETFLDLGPLSAFSDPNNDTGELIFQWTAPTDQGDYYINITVDSGFNISEYNEINNTVILHFIVGPDLIPVNVTVEGAEYPNWPQTSPVILPAFGQWVKISINISNVGISSTGVTDFWVSFYNTTISGTPTGEPPFFSQLYTGEVNIGDIISIFEADWYATSPGEFRINLTVDYLDDVDERSETNNTYVLRILVGPDIIPTNVTVNGLLQQDPINPVPIPSGLGENVSIGFNATNIGPSPTGFPVWVVLYNSTATGGQHPIWGISPYFHDNSSSELMENGAPGNDSGLIMAYWIAPTVAGTYYVTIYMDWTNRTWEGNETNNIFILCFVVGPDLTYTNISVNDQDANDDAVVWNALPGDTVKIGVNATNVGASSTGLSLFNISFWNCSGSGTNTDVAPFNTIDNLGPLLPWEVTEHFTVEWIVPNQPGDYYINITIDYLGNVSESVETNNTFILHFKAGPDYIPNNVTVNGIPYAIPLYVDTGQILTIGVNASNIGWTGSAIPFNISFMNCTVTGASIGDPPFEIIYDVPGVGVGGFSQDYYVDWKVPNEIGSFYILIEVDFGNSTWELSEANNIFILHFTVGPDYVPKNVTVNGIIYNAGEVLYTGPGETLIIDMWASNVGMSGVDPSVLYNISFWNCSSNGDPFAEPAIKIVPNLPGLSAGEDSEIQTILWIVPNIAGEYWLNITVDYLNSTAEADEENNTFILHFVVEPDLTPNNITVDGFDIGPCIQLPSGAFMNLNPVIISPLSTVTIGANVSNIGFSGTGIYLFNMTFWNCSNSGVVFGNPLAIDNDLGPLISGGFTSNFFQIWIAPWPGIATDYYINITVDSGWNLSEINELNNTYILHIIVAAPDLTPEFINVEVFGTDVATYEDPEGVGYQSEIIFIPIGENVTITFDVINVGLLNMTLWTNVTFYNTSTLGGIQNATHFHEAFIKLNGSGWFGDQTNENGQTITTTWINPGVAGFYYVNITIDYDVLGDGGRILELDEYNNTFILLFFVTSLPITLFYTGDPTYHGVIRYINSSTEINLTAIGYPPLYTHYRIYNMSNQSYATPDWVNYTVTGNFSLGAWGEGTYIIYYNTTDAFGGAEVTRNKTLVVDDTPPEATIIVGEPKYPPVTITFNVTSNTSLPAITQFDVLAWDLPLGESAAGAGIPNASGVQYIEYRILDDMMNPVRDWTIFSGDSGTFTFDSAWPDGYYTIEVRAADNLDQLGLVNSTMVYLDNTGPDTYISVGDYNWSTNPINVTSNTPFTLTAIEAIGCGANLNSLEFNILFNDGVGSTGWQSYTGPFNTSLLLLGDGNYTIQFRCSDHLGNIGPVGSLAIYVDDTPPSTAYTLIGITYIDANIWIRSDTAINLTAVDTRVGVSFLTYRILNSTGVNITDWITTSYTAEFYLSGYPQTEGLFTIEYYSVDNLLNPEPLKTLFLIVDDTPPETFLNFVWPKYREPGDQIWNITSSTELNLTWTDWSGVGVNYTNYLIDIDNDPFNGNELTSWILYTGNFRFIDYGILTDGYYTIFYNSWDYLGNNLLNSTQIYLDNTPPVTSNRTMGVNYTDGVNLWIRTNTTIDFTSVDSRVGVYNLTYRILDGFGSPITGWIVTIGDTVAFNMSDYGEGQYTIEYYGDDNLFNSETPPKSLIVIVDDTPPTTEISAPEDPGINFSATPPGNSTRINATTILNLTALDSGGPPPSGVSETWFNIDNGTPKVYTAPFNLSTELSGFPQSWGNHNISFWSTDNLGNQENITTVWVFVPFDDRPPISNITFENPKYRQNTTDILNITSFTSITITSVDYAPEFVTPVGVSSIYFIIDIDTDPSNGNEVLSNWINNPGDVVTFDFSSENVMVDGIYFIHYYGIDNLSNPEVPIKCEMVVVDNSHPESTLSIDGINFTTPEKGDNFAWIVPDTMLNIRSSDYGSPPVGLNYTEYSINGVGYNFTGGFNELDLGSLGNGTFIIEFSGIDFLDNTEENVAWTIVVDDYGPEPDISAEDAAGNPVEIPTLPVTEPIEVTVDTLFSLTAIDLGVPPTDVNGPAGISSIWHQIDYGQWEQYTGLSFNISILLQGEDRYWHHNISIRARDNLGQYGPTRTLWIYIEGDITPPLPPVLKCHVVGYDIVLEWTPSPSDDVAYYLLYRSETSTGFDFREEGIWVDTSEDSDNGKLPLRVTWNDTGAALPSAPSEYYYVIRAVDHRGNIGYTSNIAGKFTLEFKRGYNTFSVPLALFEPITGAEMLENSSFKDTTDTLYFYDTALQSWFGHPKFLPSNIDNFELVQGEAYMLFINEEEVIYTYTGSPGTAIRFIEGVGGGSEAEDLTFRESLEVTVDKATDTVQLNWEDLANADGYAVFKSEARLGEGSLNDIENLDLSLVEEVDQGVITWSESLIGMDEAYYMVVALDNSHEDSAQRASTYAVGVKKMSYTQGYSSFSLVLVPKEEKGAGQYAKEMFTWDADTIYYYDRHIGNWEGHPKFLPENINNPSIMDGEGYMIHVIDQNGIEYHFVGL